MNANMEVATLIISLFALFISGFSFWYVFLKHSDPIFCVSKWTAFGISSNGKDGSTFIVRIDINNPSSRPVTIEDFVLVVKTKTNKKILYEPIMLWDLTYYIESIGVPKKITEFQKGQIPLPFNIPTKEAFKFDYEILFMPKDIKVSVKNDEDAPLEIEVLALTDKWKDYKLVSNQRFTIDEIKNLTNGSFSGVLSTSSIENRKKLEKKFY